MPWDRPFPGLRAADREGCLGTGLPLNLEDGPQLPDRGLASSVILEIDLHGSQRHLQTLKVGIPRLLFDFEDWRVC